MLSYVAILRVLLTMQRKTISLLNNNVIKFVPVNICCRIGKLGLKHASN